MIVPSEIQHDNIVDEDTGEIVASVYHCPAVVGYIPKPYQLVINGKRIGSFACLDDIRKAINDHRK